MKTDFKKMRDVEKCPICGSPVVYERIYNNMNGRGAIPLLCENGHEFFSRALSDYE